MRIVINTFKLTSGPEIFLIKVYNALAVHIILYGSEIVIPRHNDKKRLA